MSTKPIVNIADIALETETHGTRFAVTRGEVGEALGLSVLGCMLHIVPPGKTAFPYHRHHGCDEMFFVVSGEGEYRIGDERLPVRAGDCLGAPAVYCVRASGLSAAWLASSGGCSTGEQRSSRRWGLRPILRACSMG